jgi:hypothetical protein
MNNERSLAKEITEGFEALKSMRNNEPVAYGKYIENAKMWLVVELDADMPEGYIPLYTHPVELTDEEITACIDESEPDTADMIRFARAILRKAQE